MTFDMSPLMIDFFNSFDKLLIVAARMFGFFMLMPVISGRNIPRQVRLSLVFFMSFTIFYSGIVEDFDYVQSVTGYMSILIKEFSLGYILGFVVYMFFAILYFAGQLIDYQIGFSMVSVFDPVSQIQVPVSGNFIYLGTLVIFVISGGMHVVIDAMFQSYQMVPIGTQNYIVGNEKLLYAIFNMIVYYFQFGVVIASPIVGSIIIVDVALGLLVKAVPQMNVFVVGGPIKLLIGLYLFKFSVPSLIPIFDMLFEQLTSTLYLILDSMKT